MIMVADATKTHSQIRIQTEIAAACVIQCCSVEVQDGITLARFIQPGNLSHSLSLFLYLVSVSGSRIRLWLRIRVGSTHISQVRKVVLLDLSGGRRPTTG